MALQGPAAHQIRRPKSDRSFPLSPRVPGHVGVEQLHSLLLEALPERIDGLGRGPVALLQLRHGHRRRRGRARESVSLFP